jgi:hypothetical protein
LPADYGFTALAKRFKKLSLLVLENVVSSGGSPRHARGKWHANERRTRRLRLDALVVAKSR